MTPEQRERLDRIRRYANDGEHRFDIDGGCNGCGLHISTTDGPCDASGSDVVFLLSLLTPEAEADRRLGDMVREAVRKHDEEHHGAFGIDAIAADIGSDTNYMPYVEGARILRAIAAALREEAK